LVANGQNAFAGQSIAELDSTGSAVFTPVDQGFAAIAAYLQDLNPTGVLFPFFAWDSTRDGNLYGGHFDNYPLPTGTQRGITPIFERSEKAAADSRRVH
jgi:hypothetical protein